MHEPLALRPALRAATAFPLADALIDECLDPARDPGDELFRRARDDGLAAIPREERSGHLWRVAGEVAESVAELVLVERGYHLVWHIVDPGVHGVDLLFLSLDECVLALEVKGTLRAGVIPRLTPSRLRQMSIEWLNQSDNPGMIEWQLDADDVYSGVMVVDLATPAFRVALSADHERYVPVLRLDELDAIRVLDESGDTP